MHKQLATEYTSTHVVLAKHKLPYASSALPTTPSDASLIPRAHFESFTVPLHPLPLNGFSTIPCGSPRLESYDALAFLTIGWTPYDFIRFSAAPTCPMVPLGYSGFPRGTRLPKTP
eukprot:9477723-Pyramimonas_sp.AAC.1